MRFKKKKKKKSIFFLLKQTKNPELDVVVVVFCPFGVLSGDRGRDES